MSALPPKADKEQTSRYVRFVPCCDRQQAYFTDKRPKTSPEELKIVADSSEALLLARGLRAVAVA
jgi:hypothetical protein